MPAAERIAVFDNDGTLWSEQPIYVQFVVLDQLRAAAPKHPEWQDNAAFKALVAHDRKALAALGQKPVLELLAVANSGLTVGDYDESIRAWLTSARHPQFKRPYTELVYAPMQELLAYLRATGFKAFIVSGGSVQFMRPWAEQACGIPPEQIVGSQQEVDFAMRDGKPVVTRGPKFVFVDDGPGKPVGIYRRLMLLVHHDDAAREFAYDRESHVGKLDKAWNEAQASNWIVVSMKSDWKRIFAFQK